MFLRIIKTQTIKKLVYKGFIMVVVYYFWEIKISIWGVPNINYVKNLFLILSI